MSVSELSSNPPSSGASKISFAQGWRNLMPPVRVMPGSPVANFRWGTAHTFGISLALAAIVFAIAIQVTILGGWHIASNTLTLPLVPINEAVAQKRPDAPLEYSFVGGPAVAATKTIAASADRALGVMLLLGPVAEKTTLTLGWVGIRDRRRPTNVAVPIPASENPQSLYIPLRGHSEWREDITQFAVALIAPPGTKSVTLGGAELIAATPMASLGHARARWFSDSATIMPQRLAERVIPLSAWFAFAALIAFAAIAWRFASSPRERRDAIICAALVLGGAAIAVSAWVPTAFAVNVATTTWIFAALSLTSACIRATFLGLEGNLGRNVHDAIPVVISFACVAFGGIIFSWVVIAVVAAILAKRFPLHFRKAQATLFFVPLIALGAFAQAVFAKHIAVPNTTLRDPSSLVANLVSQSGAIAGLVAIVTLAWLFLHRTQRAHQHGGFAIVLWLVVLGTLATFVVAPATEILSNSTGAFWIVMPSFVAAFAWVAPAFIAPVASTETVLPTQAKTEHDLSGAARELFDAAAGAFNATIASGSGSALASLNRMKQIAAASNVTLAAELHYALRGTSIESARSAYEALKRQPQSELSDEARGMVLAYANRSHDYSEVIARASALPPSADSTRLHARALLLSAPGAERENARLRAIDILESCPKPNELAHEIAELHMLGGDVALAQAALGSSGIALQSLPGQIYVARLGLIATHGGSTYVDQINRLATWNADLSIAQAAMGEVLLRQGNLAGARARFKLAVERDASLWAIERRLRDIDQALAEAAKAAPA